MSHFASVAKEWDTPQTIERNEIFSRSLAKYFPETSNLELMDFGCGTGLLSVNFVERSQKLIGVDTTQEMLDVFNQRFKEFKQVQALCTNLEDSSQELNGQCFDVIYTAMAFHHLKSPMETLKLFKQQLKPEGKVAVIDLDQEDGSFHPDNEGMGVHHYGFGREELQTWADKLEFRQFKHEIIHSIEKNDRIYRVALSIFSL